MTEERFEKIYKMTDKDARARAIDALPPKEYMEYMKYADRIRAQQKEQNEAKAAAPAAEEKAQASAAEAKASAPAAESKAQASAAEAKASSSAAEAKAQTSDAEAKQSVLTEHDLEQLYDMDCIARHEALKKMDSSAVQQYHEYEARRDNGQIDEEKKKKKISDIAHKLIICLCVYLTISIVNITLGYVINKAEIHASVKKEFERDACVCGIRIDGTWFKTADEAAEYLIDTHMKLEWCVVYDWNFEPYEYYTHIIKTM